VLIFICIKVVFEEILNIVRIYKKPSVNIFQEQTKKLMLDVIPPTLQNVHCDKNISKTILNQKVFIVVFSLV
jgi:hypothetical protein